MKFDVDDKNRCRLVCVKFHLNRCRFAAAVAKCLGGSLFWDTVYSWMLHARTHARTDELLDSLAKSSNTAVGPDDIHYQMLKHLPSDALQSLVNTLNDIWLSGNFPPSWHQSHIVPIPKAGKDSSDPSKYRPIALTSCVCKVMVRMVNNSSGILKEINWSLPCKVASVKVEAQQIS